MSGVSAPSPLEVFADTVKSLEFAKSKGRSVLDSTIQSLSEQLLTFGSQLSHNDYQMYEKKIEDLQSYAALRKSYHFATKSRSCPYSIGSAAVKTTGVALAYLYSAPLATVCALGLFALSYQNEFRDLVIESGFLDKPVEASKPLIEAPKLLVITEESLNQFEASLKESGANKTELLQLLSRSLNQHVKELKASYKLQGKVCNANTASPSEIKLVARAKRILSEHKQN